MITATLLDNAYLYIDAGNRQSAVDSLETLVIIDPGNVEAWEAYMQICTTGGELDTLCDRALQVVEISRVDRESILDFYYYLQQKLGSGVLDFETQDTVTIEMVNQFYFTQKDQSSEFANSGKYKNIMGGLIKILGSAMIIPQLGLLVVGLSLIFTGDSFGYWILMVLSLNVFVSKKGLEIFSIVRANQKSPHHHSISLGVQRDDISCQPELIS